MAFRGAVIAFFRRGRRYLLFLVFVVTIIRTGRLMTGMRTLHAIMASDTASFPQQQLECKNMQANVSSIPPKPLVAAAIAPSTQIHQAADQTKVSWPKHTPAIPPSNVAVLMISNSDLPLSEDLSKDTLMTKNALPYATVAAIANFAWAQHHGYKFRFVVHPNGGLWHVAKEAKLHPTFWKSYEVVRAFHELKVEWVLYLDTDALVSHHEMSFEHVIAGAWGDPKNVSHHDWLSKDLVRQVQNPYMVMGKDVKGFPGVCAGVFAVRNSLESQKAMCKWWWNTEPLPMQDQGILNSLLLEGLNSSSPSFWHDHVSILPADVLYHGDRVFHGTLGNGGWAQNGGCGKRPQSKLACIRRVYEKLGFNVSVDVVRSLNDSIVHRNAHNFDVCRSRMWAYPKIIWPQEECNKNVVGDSGKRNAIAYFVTEPTRGRNQKFEKRMGEALDAIKVAHELHPHVDIVICHAPLETWSIETAKDRFTKFISTLPDYVSVVPLARAADIEHKVSSRLKRIAEQSWNCCSWLEFQKLAVWTLDMYNSILLLDADTRFISHVDELFDCADQYDFLSTSGACVALNGGMMWLRPDSTLYESMLSYLKAGNYTRETGWHGTGHLNAEHLEQGAIRRIFSTNGMQKNAFGQETNQGFLFWYFYIRPHDLRVAQLDACIYNSIDITRGRCHRTCDHVHKTAQPLAGKIAHKGQAFDSGKDC